MEVKIEHRLTAVEDKAAANTRRIEAIEKRQNNLEDLTATVKVLATKEEQIETTVNEIKGDVKSLTSQPAQKWNGVVDKAISAVVGGLIAYVMFKLGLGI